MPVSRFAFFDVDETLINLKSMFSFRDFYLLNKYGPIVGKIIINDEQERIKKMVDDGVERSLINKAFNSVASSGFIFPASIKRSCLLLNALA